MQPSLLEEITPVPNPYPIVAEQAYEDVWRLCEQARELAWDPSKIDFSDVKKADIPREVRAAGAEWWSLRAWMEHGATPYGAERLRDAIFGHQPFEVKQHIANFIMEELRHHEASFRIARAIGAGSADYEADAARRLLPVDHPEIPRRARREGDVVLRRPRGEHALRAALGRAAAGALRERRASNRSAKPAA